MPINSNKSVFTADKNSDIFDIELPDTIKYIYLRGPDYIDFDNWPPNLKLLETYFRPNFATLPDNLEILSIVTQNEVIKADLPSKLKQLVITCPNSKPVTFEPKKDNFDLYRISIKNFGKYNVFEGGYLRNDPDNIKYHLVHYNYEVEGDEYENQVEY